MSESTIRNAFAVLDCAACGWRVYAEAEGRREWDRCCPQCGNPSWLFCRVHLIRDADDYAILVGDAIAGQEVVRP